MAVSSYDQGKDPYVGERAGRLAAGPKGRVLDYSGGDVNLDPYAYLRVFAPADASDPVIKVVPVGNGNAEVLTYPLSPGFGEVLPWPIRAIVNVGTTAGLTVHTSEPQR